MVTLHKIPTLEEFLSWPDQKPALEFIHGTVRSKAVPDFPHSLVQGAVLYRLQLWSETNQGYVLPEQRCLLQTEGETHTLVPDAVWLPQTSQVGKGPLKIPPVLAVEVLSPSNRYGAVQEKVLVYLGAGVSVVWIIDPEARNVTVYHPDGRPQVVVSPTALQDPQLPGLSISLADLFSRLPADGDQPLVRD